MGKTTRLIAFLLVLAMTLLCGCTPVASDPKTQAQNFYDYFDTVSSVLSYAGDEEAVFSSNAALVGEELARYHKLFDIYYEYSGVVNLCTLNRRAGDGPVEVSRELFDFLVWAKEMYTLTEGKVNVAMGSVLSIWHDVREAVDDGATEGLTMPTDAQLAEAELHVDVSALFLDEENCTVYYADPYMKLDVGALAKGYATERIARLLIERGVNSYVLNIGGNIRAIGTRPSGEGWVTGITNPDKSSDEAFVLRMRLKDASLVTSGDYERYFTYNGKKYHHIIDPNTLYPAKYFSSVSILTEDSALADALSTALFCMSYEEGSACIERLGALGYGVDVLWVDTEGGVRMTDGFSSTVIR